MTQLTAALKHRMNHLVARQGVVSGNIANAGTPGYVARDLHFQNLVAANRITMATPAAGHVQPSAVRNIGRMTYDRSNVTVNGNSVKLDQEMVKLNDVQLNYRMTTELMRKYAAMYRAALGRAQ